MAYLTVMLSQEKRVATITLNRPEALNAMNRQMGQDLRAAIDEVRQDKAIRVLIITGAGNKAFSAGRDLKEYSQSTITPIEEWSRRMEPGSSFGLMEMPKPVLAAINGYAIGEIGRAHV